MNTIFRAFAVSAVSLLSVLVTQAQAVSPQSKSSGLEVTISNVAVNERVASIQLDIKNTSQQRQYFFLVKGQTARAAITSGELLGIDEASGVTVCGNDYDSCLRQDWLKDYNNLSYVEPSDSMVATLNFIANGAIPSSQYISFPLILGVRTAVGDPATEAVPTAPGPLHAVRFNFSRIGLPN